MDTSFNIIKMLSNNCVLKTAEGKGEGLYALKSFKRGETVYVC